MTRLSKITFLVFMICMAYAYATIWSISHAEKQAFADNTAVAHQIETSAVVFVYHRIGEDRFQDSNLPYEQFEAHIQAMALENYNVLSVGDILTSIDKKETLPERTIAVTFEGAYKPTLDAALPLLVEHDIPFTIFLSPERVDWESDKYLSWDDLRKLKRKYKKLVSFGLIPGKYEHLTSETMAQYGESLNFALGRFREELDLKPDYITYPYGEFDQNIQKMVQDYGFKAAFAQQSGVVYEGSDRFALPRFSMTSSYGGLDRFQLMAGSKALPVELSQEYVSLMSDISEDKVIQFSVTQNVPNLSQISCFASSVGKIETMRDGHNIQLHISKEWLSDKLRVNCTLPYNTSDEDQNMFETGEQWYWFGMLFQPMT